MKFNVLASIGHNLADSLSDCSLLTGHYSLDPFGDAARSTDGFVELDLLAGRCTSGEASDALRSAASLVAARALPELCAKAGGSPADFRALSVRYFADVRGPAFEVTVENQAGRRRTDFYVGLPGRRPRLLDPLERIRTARK